MKALAMATMTALMGMAAQARVTVPAAEFAITVCTEGNADFTLATKAQGEASAMFASAGVTVTWRQGLNNCPADAILITLGTGEPATFHPGALAYAMPYEGAHIHLFYDRIARGGAALTPHLLAHVLTHEITHILEGVDRHSEDGVMKPHWDGKDYGRMIGKPLGFAPIDVDLIHTGLAVRTARENSVTVAGQ